MTRVKICGLKDGLDLEGALQAGADAVGFIVEIEQSRRCISASAARELIEMVPPFVASVAVIHPRDLDDALRLAEDTGADLLQIHSRLKREELRRLRDSVSQRIIIACRAEGDEALQMAPLADAILLDTCKNGVLGGTGETHDWNLSARLVRELKVPVVLAGGLGPDNVCQAVRTVRPHAVDVASGVEVEGRKDRGRMEQFVEQVRSCR